MRHEGLSGRNDPRAIRTDFDRIARCSTDRWDHNVQYHGFLLKRMPSKCGTALDLGCGTGAFARLLAQRSERVLALDLSTEMIRRARERSSGCPNIDFQVGDALRWDFGSEQFDCIASIATLHHLPLEEIVPRLRQALKSNGVLLILDLREGEGWDEKLQGAAALPLSAVLKMLHNRRLRPAAETRAAWDEHGRHDVYPTVAEIRRVYADLLPGAQLTKHLFWRYSIVWHRP